jgi:hypothetical protein
MAGEDFYSFIEYLKACGVQTHHPWTRHGVEALCASATRPGILEVVLRRGERCDKLPRSVKWETWSSALLWTSTGRVSSRSGDKATGPCFLPRSPP